MSASVGWFVRWSIRWAMAVLWCALFASAVAVVWSRHEARSLFIQLQALHARRDALDIEWGQLKLEQSAWATHGRVEQTARVDLRMVIPRPQDVRIVTPGTEVRASRSAHGDDT